MFGRRDRTVGHIRYDSRRVGPGDIYVAVNARDDRALDYLPKAIESGATTIVSDAPDRLSSSLLVDNDLTLVVVDDARRAMAEMAHRLMDYPGRKLKIYGVTGTNGKTTVTFVLQQLLEACGERTGVIGTLGTMLGTIRPTGFTTPESPELVEILREMVDNGYSSVAMEVSSHALSLHRVAGIMFDGALFTNLTQDHLDFHLTMQDYRDTKKVLFDQLNDGRPGVVNVDDPNGEWMVHDCHAVAYRYGTAQGADACIRGVELRAGISRWEVTFSERLGGGDCTLISPLVGAFNVANVTAALTLAIASGYDRTTLLDRVGTLRPVPGRMESIGLDNDTIAVVDYAHTPDALENVISALREVGAGKRLTVVFGCGGDRDRTKRPLMGEVASRLADRLIVTSDNPRNEDPSSIIEDVIVGVPSGIEVERIVDRREAIERALEDAPSGSIVLIAGKGHEDYQIIGSERRHFSDREVVIAWRDRSRDRFQGGEGAGREGMATA